MNTFLTVPMVPPSVNELRRKYRNPHVYRRLREDWEMAILAAAKPPVRRLLKDFAMDHPMFVRITIFHYATVRRDADNLAGCQKPILDALHNLQFIHDDSRQWLELGEPVEFITTDRKMETKTVIEISPFDPGRAA